MSEARLEVFRKKRRAKLQKLGTILLLPILGLLAAFIAFLTVGMPGAAKTSLVIAGVLVGLVALYLIVAIIVSKARHKEDLLWLLLFLD